MEQENYHQIGYRKALADIIEFASCLDRSGISTFHMRDIFEITDTLNERLKIKMQIHKFDMAKLANLNLKK